MDPARDYHKIWATDFLYEFPWDTDISLWLGFYNTITPPNEAKLLVRTGEFLERSQQRLDEQATLMWEMTRHGFADSRGTAAMRQMNRIHKNAVKHISVDGEQWSIGNQQYLFALASTLVFPQRWLDQHGWRRVSPTERRAAVLFYREFGQHMGLKDIPETYEEFERFLDDYEAAHIVYSPEAARLWAATRQRLAQRLVFWLPPRLWRWAMPIGERIMPVLLTDTQRRAFGVDTPSRPWRATVHAGLRFRAWLMRRARPRVEPAYPERMPSFTYPAADYEVAEMGPEHSVRRRRAATNGEAGDSMVSGAPEHR